MKQINNWDNIKSVKEGGNRLPPGGYVCKIIDAADDPAKEYLKVAYDIENGEYIGHFRKLYERYPERWSGVFFRSYKEKAVEFFKGFITSIEKSNSPFTWQWNEKELKGKLIGLVLGEEEYINGKGDIKIRLYVAQVHSIDTILSNDFKVPELKVLQGQNTSSFGSEVLPDEDIPF